MLPHLYFPVSVDYLHETTTDCFNLDSFFIYCSRSSFINYMNKTWEKEKDISSMFLGSYILVEGSYS
ncbi:unnamed protein product [Lathyrus oleraceus]